MREFDYVVVGSGLTGATIARLLYDAGRNVIVVDRRTHAGGNVFDETHPSGIRIHTYGPHYFRTSSDEIWKFVNRFGRFYKYEAVLKSYVDGRYENWPLAASYIRREIGSDWKPGFSGTPSNFEEASLSIMPRVVYEKFVKGYTEKQWGVPAPSLAAGLAKRLDVREDDDPRLVRHTYQGIPIEGYAQLMKNILANIPVLLNFDFLRNREVIQPTKKLIFTGPIDEFFDYDLGRLAYRGQLRVHEYLANDKYALPCAQVNNPALENGDHIRTLEWKQMMPKQYAERITGTVLTRETTISPKDANNYEYPFPNERNKVLYERYKERANAIPNLLVCGRLGEYRYYDMDQAIARARKLASQLVETID